MQERDSKNIGAAIRQRRQALGLTQETVAERAGMSAEGFARIERAHRTPTLDSLLAICRALGASPNELLRWDDEAERRDPVTNLRKLVAARLADLDEADLRFLDTCIDYAVSRG